MRKSKKQRNTKQMELNLQIKESAKSIQPDKSIIHLIKLAQPTKSIKSVKAERSNTSLSNKSTKSKVKEKACGRKKPSGTLFVNLITTEELAVIFRVSSQTIRNWVARGKIPHVQIGRRNLFHMGSLQQWLNRKEEPLWE